MGTEAQDSVKTQKAKGILALSQYGVKTFTTEMVKQAKVLKQPSPALKGDIIEGMAHAETVMKKSPPRECSPSR